MQFEFKETPYENPKQIEFCKAKTRFIAYGGARGGGKSWSVRFKAVLMALNYAGIVILILRKTMPELEKNHIVPLRDMCCSSNCKIADYNETKKTLTFVNGSIIYFGYCASDGDVERYRGNEYDIIFIDEATHFTEEQFSRIYPSSRGSNDFPKRIYLTTNPGGVGHGWVKRLFIDKEYRDGEKPENYTFIKATVFDNKPLLRKQPDYVDDLKALPPELREAWLYGEWNLLSGQYFSEFNEELHVVKPFVIPSHWIKYVTIDYGLDMAAIYWVAVDENKRCYVYKELHEPNLNVYECAKAIKEMTQEVISLYIAPKDLFSRKGETGKSAADIFQENGISLTKINSDRISGWLAMKELMRCEYDHLGYPNINLRFFDTCKYLIKYLPLLQFNEKKPRDIATKPHLYTHCADSIRYFCSYWFSAAQIEKPKEGRKLIATLEPHRKHRNGGFLS